jgi:excisionase family DNA binding protein
MVSPSLPEPIYLSAPKAALLCGVSRNTICCWIRDGKLSSYTTAGGKYLIRPTDLVKFMEVSHMFIPQALRDMATRDEQLNSPAPTPAAAPGTATSAPTVLVVDDDARAREMAVRALDGLQANVLQAENGYEALHLLTKHPDTSLVLLDLVMPGQDGVRTYREIRAKNSELPVIVITGYPPEDTEKAFGQTEPDLLLTKPYSAADLGKAAAMMIAR